MDIQDIKDQPLHTLLANFFMCEKCRFVDRDTNRFAVGYKCHQCGTPSEGGRLYFPIGALSLIDLMQEFYHLNDSNAKNNSNQEKNNQLAVVIFFCSLTEVYLQNFLEELMATIGIPIKIQERLLADNLFVRTRVEKLFPTLTGMKWKKALRNLTAKVEVELDYEYTAKFYLRVSNARNKFLHAGNKGAIHKDMPKQCLEQIWPLSCLFASLHNEFIAQPLINHLKPEDINKND